MLGASEGPVREEKESCFRNPDAKEEEDDSVEPVGHCLGGVVGERGARGRPILLVLSHRQEFGFLALNWVWIGVEWTRREFPS